MKASTVARWATLVVWAAVAASAVLWGLRLFAPGQPVPGHAVSVSGAQALRGDPIRLLGHVEAPAPETVALPAAPSRFKLLGVVAPRSPQAAAEGLALIAIDDKPARAYRVGAVVEGDLVLQRVRARGADLGVRGADQPNMALEAPPLVPALAGGARPVPPAPALRLPPGIAARALPVPTPAAIATPAQAEGQGDDTEPDAAPASPGPPRPEGGQAEASGG